jgi:hypothetical protein
MNLLLAPNGKPSNLTPEQYKLVRTPEFKAWFGDWENDPANASKVVDENGEPMQMYHNTNNNNFTIFDKEKLGDSSGWETAYLGFYFGNKYEKGAYGKKTIKCFLNIRNPFLIKTEYYYQFDYEYKRKSEPLLMDDFFNKNKYDGILIDVEKLQEGETMDKVFVAFEPEQIKLADGTNTTFDGNNPDIRFTGGGDINISNDFVGTWEQLKKENPNLWETGILRRSQNPQGANDIIPKDVFIRQFQWQNYGQYNEIEAETIYGEPDNYGYYNDTDGNPITDERTGNYLKDEFDYENNAERIKATISNKQLKNNLIDSFQTQQGTEYLEKVIATLPKNIDGTITAYRIGNIGDSIQSYTLSEGMAKTFSNQGTDIMPSGLPTIPNEGYKEYGVLPVNMVKINPKGIVAWSPYDSEILVEPKYVKFNKNNTDFRYKDGGNVNWNLDRYREIEKEMYDLQTQGKGDTLEYFKLIKERAILEQAKMNPSSDIKKTKMKKYSDNENYFAKGGKVVVLPADVQKYKKIGIEDKYFIEASKEVGLQGINFDSQSILKRIESQFNDMLDRYKFYLIDEDSPSITNYINNQIETHKEQGSSLETIQRWEDMKENPTARRGIIDDINKTQNESLEKWVDYLRLSEYKLPFKFLMLKAVLNFNYDLKQSKLFERGRDTIRNFTPFDAGSLAELNEKNSDFLLLDYSIIMNENSKKILNSQEVVQQSGNGKWIKFNGGNKTKPEDIQKNGTRLMNLVQNTYWCTKSAGTSQLRGGDFYVYVTETNGEIFPRIAVRMKEDNVAEVRGNRSSAQDIDAEMLPIAEEFLLKNIPNSSGKKWLDSIRYNQKCVEMRKRFEAEGMYKDFIYDYMKLIADKNKYKVDYGANGNVVLLEQKFAEIINIPNEYYQKGDIVIDYNFLSPNTIYYMGDLGYYELNTIKNKFEDISKLKLVSGDFNPSSFVTNDFGNIEYVGGNVTLSSNNANIGKLKYIGGGINFGDANIKSLSDLESVGGLLVLKSTIRDLGKLKKIGGLEINACDENFSLGSLEEIQNDLQILNFSVDINFGNLKTIGGSLYAQNTIITDLKNLESVGGDFLINGSKIKKFENLKTIGGNADFSNNFCSNTQNIETILGNIKFLNSRITEFPKLNKIGGTIEFRGSLFKSFGNIRYIGGNLNFAESKLEELGELDYVGGYVSFKGSKIKSLNKLKKVVGFANFDTSLVEDLGDLESVGGNIYLVSTKIKSLGKLNYVGGMVMMKNNNYKGLEGNYDAISEQLKK